MTRATLILLSAGLVACNTPARVIVTNGQRTVDVTTSGRVGGRGGTVVRDGTLTVATYDNNDRSFRELNSTVRTGIAWWGAQGVTSDLGNAFSGAYQQRQMTERAAIRSREAVDLSRIAAENPPPSVLP